MNKLNKTLLSMKCVKWPSTFSNDQHSQVGKGCQSSYWI